MTATSTSAEFDEQARRAALDFQRPGQDFIAAADAAPDTLLHGVPDAQQGTARFRFRTKHRFVGQHDFGNRQAVGMALRDQFVAGGEGVGRWRDTFIVLADPGLDDETAAGGEIAGVMQHGTAWIKSDDTQAVRMLRHGLVRQEQEFLGFDETDFMFSGERQALFAANVVQPGFDQVGVTGFRCFATQAEEDPHVRAVTFSGGTQRAVQFDPQPCRAAQDATFGQCRNKHPSGAHRPDGMRTGRPDADGEELECADGHCFRWFRSDGA